MHMLIRLEDYFIKFSISEESAIIGLCRKDLLDVSFLLAGTLSLNRSQWKSSLFTQYK